MDYHKTREQFVAEQKAKLDIDNLLALSNKRMVNCKGELFKNQPELVFSHAHYEEVELPYDYREAGGGQDLARNYWERYHETMTNYDFIKDALSKAQ